MPGCPIRVRLAGEGRWGVVVETMSLKNVFDDVPWEEWVPQSYLVGARRVLHVEDGWLVAYSAASAGELFWASEDGQQRRSVSGARIVGFTRAPSGTILALAIGRARLGRGGVLALDHRPKGGAGEYATRLVASLPLEPSPVATGDADGRLLGFAQGFIFGVDESGRVENIHYVARNLGSVASLARSLDGTIYLGVECGVFRLVPDPASGGYREEFWSAKSGASGQWSSCVDV
jgi:hypothetical protein